MKKKIAIIGSTGSIGKTVLKIVKNNPTKFRIKLLTANTNYKELLKQTIEKIQDDNTNPDFYSAIRICKKRRIGPYRPDANKEIFYKKDMGVLARSGFSYDLSKEILALDKKQLKIYEKKL